jgi:hypothetical protein
MPPEKQSENLKGVIAGLWKIDASKWNKASQKEHELMTDKVIGHFRGKLTNAELGYLEETNHHTAVRVLTMEEWELNYLYKDSPDTPVRKDAVKMSKSTLALEQVFINVGWTDKWIAEGEAQASLKIARNLLADGDSPERVAKNTGLPIAKVKALLKTTKVKCLTDETDEEK